MAFRAKVEPARSKRIAHTDLHSQMNRLGAMGTFNKGEDAKFFADLQSFFDVAYRHVFAASAPSAVRQIPTWSFAPLKKQPSTIAATDARRFSEQMMFSISRASAETYLSSPRRVDISAHAMIGRA
jgi:hypothetical protein